MHCARFLTVLLLLSIDPSLGKIDKASLSQQTLMEIFVQSIGNVFGLAGPRDNRADVSDWRELEFDESGQITEMWWASLNLTGTADLKWLPPTLKMIQLNGGICGTVDFTDLPECLEHCAIGGSQFSGTMDLTRLPGKMERLFAFDNRFSGSIDLTQLPPNFIELNVSENTLSGTLDLTALPKSLHTLILSLNDFSGETDFSRLPEALERLDLSENPNLSGTFRGTFYGARFFRTKVVVVRENGGFQ